MTVVSTVATIATTALASGSIAAVVSHFLTADRERRSLLRQKAEDLYVSVEAWENSWALTVVSLQGVVRGSIDYDQYLELVIEQGNKADGALNRRVNMLTEIYFPGALGKLKGVVDALDGFNTVAAAHKETYRAGTVNAFQWGRDFAPRVTKVATAFSDYRKAVVRCAQTGVRPLRQLKP